MFGVFACAVDDGPPKSSPRTGDGGEGWGGGKGKNNPEALRHVLACNMRQGSINESLESLGGAVLTGQVLQAPSNHHSRSSN